MNNDTLKHITLITDDPLVYHDLKESVTSTNYLFAINSVPFAKNNLRDILDDLKNNQQLDLIAFHITSPSQSDIALHLAKLNNTGKPIFLLVAEKQENIITHAIKQGLAYFLIIEQSKRYLHLFPHIAQHIFQQEERFPNIVAIQQSKQEWESTIDSLSQLICLVNNEQKVVRANRIVESWNLNDITHIKGRSIHYLLHPDCQDSDCYLSQFIDHSWPQLLDGIGNTLEIFDPIIKRHLRIELKAASTATARMQDFTTNVFAILLVRDISTRVQAQVAEKEQRELAETLQDVMSVLNSTLNREQVLKLILNQLARVVPYDKASIRFLEQDNLTVVAYEGFTTTPTNLNIRNLPFASRLINEKIPVIIDDSFKEPLLFELPNRAQNRSWISAPLIVKDNVIGILTLIKQTPAFYDQFKTKLIVTFANQAAVTIENARLFETTNRQLEELELLQSLTEAMIESLTEDELIEKTLDIAHEKLNYEHFGVLLYSPKIDRLYVHPSYRGIPEEAFHATLSLDDSVSGSVFTSGRLKRIDDISKLTNYVPANPSLPLLSELCIPLKTGDRVVGVINAEKAYINGFSVRDERLLTIIAAQLATGIDRLRTEINERERVQQLNMIYDVGRRASSILNLDELLQEVSRLIIENLNLYNVEIVIREHNLFVCRAGIGGYTDSDYQPKFTIKLGQGIIGHVAKTGQSLLVPDTSLSPYYLFEKNLPFVRSELAIPLQMKGNLIGVLDVKSDFVHGVTAANAAMLEILADQIATAIDNAWLFEATRRNVNEMRTLNEIVRSLNTHEEITEGFIEVAEGLKRITNCAKVRLILIESNDHLRYLEIEQVAIDLSGGELHHYSKTKSANDLLFGLPHLASNLALDINYPVENSLYKAGYQSQICFPLRPRQQVIGALNLIWHEKAGYNSTQLPILTQITGSFALALEQKRLLYEKTSTAQKLHLLNQVISASSNLPEETKILQSGCDALGTYFAAPQVTASLQKDTYQVVTSELIALGRSSSLGQKLVITDYPTLQAVYMNGRPYTISNISIDTKLSPLLKKQLLERQTESLLICPIMVRGQVIGTIIVELITNRTYTDEEINFAQTLGQELGRALETIYLYERLRTHADDLEVRVLERTKELTEAYEQLKELDLLKNKFVADVSHELRTPVASLNLYLELLTKGKIEKRERYIGILQKQGTRLMTLIEDVLHLSRIDLSHENIKNEFALFDLNELVDEIAQMQQYRAEALGLGFEFIPHPESLFAYGNKNQFSQIVTNLIANAVNYTKTGSITVTTLIDETKEKIGFSVQDTGMGIPKEDINHLFERFYRGHNAGQSDIPGSGLGLAIVKEIVDLHHGVIDVSSEINIGTIMHVWLPIPKTN